MGIRRVKHELPSGSKIMMGAEGGATQIAIPHPSAGFMRFFMGLFILFWLGGWAWGWHSAFSSLSSGTAKGGGTFLIFWLGAWTVGGIMAAYWLYRLLRPSVPETLRLTSNGVAYDSGVPPQSYHTGWSENSARQW